MNDVFWVKDKSLKTYKNDISEDGNEILLIHCYYQFLLQWRNKYTYLHSPLLLYYLELKKKTLLTGE